MTPEDYKSVRARIKRTGELLAIDVGTQRCLVHWFGPDHVKTGVNGKRLISEIVGYKVCANMAEASKYLSQEIL